MEKYNILNEKYNCIYCNKEFNTKKSGICHQNLYCKLKPAFADNDLMKAILVLL